MERFVTIIYAAFALLILPFVYWARGPKYAVGALPVLTALYAASLWLITASMP